MKAFTKLHDVACTYLLFRPGRVFDFLDNRLCAPLGASLYRQGIGSEGRGICGGPCGFPSPSPDPSREDRQMATKVGILNRRATSKFLPTYWNTRPTVSRRLTATVQMICNLRVCAR